VSRLIFAFVCALGWSFAAAPGAFAQKDVHAVLIHKADRKPAPTFHFVSDTGQTVQPSSYRGKVVLLNFWATKCGGCVLEIPSFVELQKSYAGSGFTAVGISADIPYSGLKNSEEAWRQVRPFIVSHKLNYPILMGNDSIVDAYGFEAYPATYLIDRSGKIAATYVGVVDKSDVEANIKRLLAER
jgi:peroxiredoxin